MGLRVHELARELKISTAALKHLLKDIGVVAKSHMSTIEKKDADNIRKKFEDERKAQKEIEQRRKQFRKKSREKKKKAAIKKTEKKKKSLNITSDTVNSVLDKLETESHSQKKSSPKKKTTKTTDKKTTKKTDKKTIKKVAKKTVKKVDKKVVKKKNTAEKKSSTDTKKVSKSKKESIFDKRRKKHSTGKKITARVKHSKKPSTISEKKEKLISKKINQTLSKTKKRRKKKRKQVETESSKSIIVSEFTSVSELAKLMDVAPTEIVVNFMNMGQMVTINKRLDKDSLELICAEMEFDVEFQDEYGKKQLEEQIEEEISDAEELHRPPVVTIMGHVDHGKTSVLDYIQKSDIADGEAGKITQHIGAYQIKHNDKKITFIDTPGHEAFTAMRSRGANITDIVVIVVAANDSVMPQTEEAIDHAKAAGVPIIIAINKIDLPEANVQKTINDLIAKEIYLEGYGGEVQFVECSAKTGEGIDDLLESILLLAEVEEFKAVVDVHGVATVIEAAKDPSKGNKVSILLQKGTLDKGDIVVCGATYGRIRKLEDDKGAEIKETLKPSDIAVIYGLKEVPKTGDKLNVLDSEQEARQIATERNQIRRNRERYTTTTNLNNIFDKIKKANMTNLNLILKADTDGSVEALADSLQKLSNNEISINIVRKAVGGIKATDVDLAVASEAIIIGLHVRANNEASTLADQKKIDIKNYNIIYDAIKEIKNAMEGLLGTDIKEKIMGTVEVKQIFKISKLGTVAGSMVTKGKISNKAKIKIYRDDIMIYEGDLKSLKRFQNEVKIVETGQDCGIMVEKFNDIKVGDIIEAFELIEIKRTLK